MTRIVQEPLRSGRGDCEDCQAPARAMSRATRAIAVAVVSTVLIGACGIGLDEKPRTLEAEASTTTVAESPSAGQLNTVLYYVRDGRLVPVDRELPDRTASTIISSLSQSPTPSIPGVGTSLPPGTRVLGTARGGDHLVVDLSRDFDTVVGLARQQAVGQMVMSVTRGPIDNVEFQVDGRPLTVSSPRRGDTTVVGQCDFAELLADPTTSAAEGLSASSVHELAKRREALSEECPAS